MEQDLGALLDKMAKGTLTEEEALLIEAKARRFSDLHQLAEARNEWREALRKVHDERARAASEKKE